MLPACLLRFLCSVQGPGGQQRSGENMGPDTMEKVHLEIWKLQPQSKSKVTVPPPPGAPAGTQPTFTTKDVPMPVNWLHKNSLTFALLGRPAGLAGQYHCLALEDGSGVDIDTDLGGGRGQGSGGKRKKACALSDPTKLLHMKQEGKVGPGIPESRADKRRSKELQRREVKQEKRHKHQDDQHDRLMDLLANPKETRADTAIIGYLSHQAEREEKKDIVAARQQEVDSLKAQIQLCKDLGDDEFMKKIQRELLELLRTPLPSPKMHTPLAPPAPAAAPAASQEIDLSESGAEGEADREEWEEDQSDDVAPEYHNEEEESATDLGGAAGAPEDSVVDQLLYDAQVRAASAAAVEKARAANAVGAGAVAAAVGQEGALPLAPAGAAPPAVTWTQPAAAAAAATTPATSLQTGRVTVAQAGSGGGAAAAANPGVRAGAMSAAVGQERALPSRTQQAPVAAQAQGWGAAAAAAARVSATFVQPTSFSVTGGGGGTGMAATSGQPGLEATLPGVVTSGPPIVSDAAPAAAAAAAAASAAVERAKYLGASPMVAMGIAAAAAASSEQGGRAPSV